MWPRVDDYLDEPDESHRWERIGDERMEASLATASPSGRLDLPELRLDDLAQHRFLSHL